MVNPCLILAFDDSLLAVVLGFLDGKSLAKSSRICGTLRAQTSDADDARGAAAKLWRDLCARHGYRQPGTRTRNFLAWSTVYANNRCVECDEAGSIVITDRSLPWPNGRFSLCAQCLRSQRFARIGARPEINHDSTRLGLTLFRIATVRRELGYARKDKPRSSSAGRRRRTHNRG